MRDLLTISAIKAHRRCPRLYKLRYEDRWRVRRQSEELRLGTAVHAGLECLWRGDPLPEVEGDPWVVARVRAMLAGYAARWEGEPWRTIAVEQEFRAPLVNPATGYPSQTWEIAGKIDALATDGERVYIVEHKTSSEDVSAGGDYWRRLRLDGQISLYYAGARALGHEVAGCLYDVLGKPGLKPLKATPEDKRRFNKDGSLDKRQRLTDETPEDFHGRLVEEIASAPEAYYSRGVVVRLEAEEREAAQDIWQTAAIIRDARRTGCWPRSPDSCFHYGRACDYWGVCVGEESLDDGEKWERVENAHTELEGAK